MKKYDLSYKLKVIRHYLTTHDSYVITAERFGIGESTLSKWLNQYKLHGKQGLKPSKPTHSMVLKYQLIQELQSGKSARQIALEHNLSAGSVVSNWKQRYEQQGLSSLDSTTPHMQPKPPKPDKDKTKAELLEEIAYLRAECAYIKKSIALAQNKATQKKPQ